MGIRPQSAWMIGEYFTEKALETSGKIRGYTGIWSYRLRAGGWGECFRKRHRKDEGVEDGEPGVWEALEAFGGFVGFMVEEAETEQTMEVTL